MLASIAPYVTKYAHIVATVTGIDVEVVSNSLVRIAGTGMYSQGVGESIEKAGEVYRYVLKGDTTFIMSSPREHFLCKKCKTLPHCRETFSICTPITYNGRAIGIIGLVCFTEKERARMLSNQEVYKDFTEQIASFLAMTLEQSQKDKKNQQFLDTIMQINNNDIRGIIILNAQGVISYINTTARENIDISDDTDVKNITVRKTGTSLYDMEEFEMLINGRHIPLVGNFFHLNSDDQNFQQALVFDSLPKYTKMLSHLAHATEASSLEAIIGESTIMHAVKQKILQIAQTSSTVLITGESGTGKEMVARAIHATSERHDKPFIPLNCGAIPDTLLESELFGYVSGAFTGANPSGYIGKFELAHQGVLFLDEISTMPLYLQVKLLRVLQDKRITRLGSNRTIDVDVRIISATNESLPTLINERMFRDDLYYRLNVVPLLVPPLRERIEDIPAFANFFLHKYCQLFSKKNIRPSASLLKALSAYHWPGNVREFENIMEYLVNIMSDGGVAPTRLLPEKILLASKNKTLNPTETTVLQRKNIFHLPDNHPATLANTQSFSENTGSALTNNPVAITPLAELEQYAITHALTHYGDTVQGKHDAAQALGIGIATLYRKLKQYEIKE